MAYGTITVTDVATRIVAANPNRISLIIANTSSTVVFYAEDSSVTSATGLPMIQYGSMAEDSGGTKVYCGAVWGIVASGSSDVRYWERTRQT